MNRSNYADVYIHTEDGQIVEWLEFEISCYIPSLFNFMTERSVVENIKLVCKVHLDSCVINFLKYFFKNKVVDPSLTFPDLENILRCIQKFPKNERRSIEDALFEQFFENINMQNCVGMWLLAKDLEHEGFTNKTITYVLQNLRTSLLKKSTDIHFYRLTLFDLLELITDDRLAIRTEADVIEIILQWIDAIPNQRTVHLRSLLEAVRKSGLPKLSSEPSRSCPNDVLILGGYTRHGASHIIEHYDLINNRWGKLYIHLPYPVCYHAAATIDNDIFIIGGDGGKGKVRKNVMRLRDGVWEPMASMNENRMYISNSCCVVKGEIYVMGGFDSSPNAQQSQLGRLNHRLRSAEKYNPSTNEWTLLPQMMYERSDAACAVIKDRIYVVGGFDGDRLLDSVEVFDPFIKRWYLVASLPSPRSGLCAAEYSDQLLALGGFDGTSRRNNVFRYDAKSNTWREIDSMISARSNFSVNKIGNDLLAIGGYSGNSVCNNVEIFYDESWHTVEGLKSAKSACATVNIPRKTLLLHARRSSSSTPISKRKKIEY